MDAEDSRFAAWDQVAETVRRHVTHYVDRGGGENALVGLRAEGAVTLQYAGRVVLELFQNALDRAETLVVVRFDGQRLVVGNDGHGVSVAPEYDYDHPIEGVGRSDFHALCALHTSNKSPDRQFGNKGIGFRSVFGVSDSVRLWTRCSDGGWWGMELRQRLVPARWEESALPDADSRIRALGHQERPSFHFPRLLRADRPPVSDAEGIHTLVVVEIDDPEDADQILHEVQRLARTRFQFVGLRRPGLTFALNGAEVASESGWPLETPAVYQAGFPDLAELADKAQHPVTAPRVSVAWPGEPVASDPPTAGWFYNHLPTKMPTGLPVDVHADFQVKADREGMALGSDNDVGRYNVALMQRAAKGHVEALCREAESQDPRADLWLLAARPDGARKEWTDALLPELFPDGSFRVWVKLAMAYFKPTTPSRAAREFWAASLQWVKALVGYSEWSQTWGRKAADLCAQLSKADVPLIPMESETGTRLVPLPSRESSGRRARRVFFRSPQSTRGLPPIPDVLVRQGRVVTSFPMERFEGPASVRPFVENELLTELRQVPHHSERLEIEDPLTAEEQGSLLLFASRLTIGRRPSHFAWRAFADNDDSERVGRALSTMFLPTIEGRWEPARQLSMERVHLTHLQELMEPEVELAPFLRLLGVAPDGGVPILEEGPAGLVPSQASPPRPQPAGERSPLPPLLPVLKPGTEPSAVRASVTGLPDDTHRSGVHAQVRDTAWLSSDRFKSFDGVPALPPFVSPLDVVVHSNDRQRTLFAVPEHDEDERHLAALGALTRPNDDRLAGRVSPMLRRLRARVPNPDALPASVGLLLAALFNRLMPLLGEAETEVPVLVEQAGHRRWLDADAEAWIARREERQEIRRFYPDLPLVSAEYRTSLPQQLGVKEVKLRKQVRPAVDEASPTVRAQTLVARIAPHLAVFAAVAEQSRQVVERLSPERFQRAWNLQNPVLEVPDAWIEVRVEGPEREPEPWGKLRYEDVFYVPGPKDEVPGVIIFDMDPKHGDDASKLPPLRYFGNAMASLLVNNTLLGAAFAQVLASIDEGRIDDYIERHHLAELVKEWQSKLRPLADEERARLVAALAGVSSDPTGVLARGRVTKAELLEDLDYESAPAVASGLEAQVARQLVTYLPVLTVQHEHADDWRKWWARWKVPLEALVNAFGDLRKSWKRQLADAVKQATPRLDFTPEGTVASFLATHGHDLEDLQGKLEEMTPSFAQVTSAPMALSTASWRVGIGRSGNGAGGPHRKLTPEDIVQESLMLGAIGDGAEVALLSWVVEQAELLREHPDFDQTVLGVFKPETRTHKVMKAALSKGDLAAALHVAQHWSGAGFDILGVETDGQELFPVRYECKGIAASSRRVRIHLSRNELGVARRVHRDGPGTWKLVGVEPDGQCVDLTPTLADLLAEDEEPLQELYERGLEPDGLRLVIERGGASADRTERS